MSLKDKRERRTKALYKLGNQLSVLSRTARKADLKTVSQMQELAATLA